MAVDSQLGRPSIGLTLALGAIGVTSLDLALCGLTHSPGMALARAGGLVLAMLVLFRLVQRRGRPASGSFTHRETVALLAAGLAPALWHPARCALRGEGLLVETLVLEGLRNLGIGLVLLSGRPQTARLTAVVALFGVLVGASLVEGPIMTGLAAAFALVGAGWLVAGYWAELPALRLDGGGGRGRSGAVVALATAVPLVLVASLCDPTAATMRLAGLMPSSGGADWSDPEARAGVGDGPNEVDARDSADSVGFTQSEVYLESDQPSLYDTFSETFGEPVPRPKQEPAIALGPNPDQAPQEHPAEDHRAGREFQTHRKPPARSRIEAATADALLYVQGPAPAHLRLVAYDRFDGATWHEAGPPALRGPLRVEAPGSPWLRTDASERSFLGGRASHRIKVGRLEAATVPAPAHLDRFRVGSVNRVEFFEWAQPEILRMAGRTIPIGTVIDTEVRTPRPAALRTLPMAPSAHDPQPAAPGDAPISPSLVRLVREWTAGVPHGWARVEAVVAGLRARCRLDREATAPEACPDRMAHFLDETRRGPDYLFATAAALALRELGFPTRVVGGLYVDPDRFDPAARHVAVTAEAAHLWVEVQVPGGDWITIEPTPGFELMPPAYAPLERLQSALLAAWDWAVRHAAALGLVALGLTVIGRFRRPLFDALATLAWRVALPRVAPRRAVFETLRLVERRARWAGCARPAGQTPLRWCEALAPAAPEPLGTDLQRLVRLAQQHAYGSGPRGPADDGRALCRRVLGGWSLRTFRLLADGHRRPLEPSA